jgi:hypothetical protein
MRRLTFAEWLGSRDQEAPAAENLSTLIAQEGAVGISLDRLRKVVRLSPEALDDVLNALIAAGQVMVLKVNGERVYRASG